MFAEIDTQNEYTYLTEQFFYQFPALFQFISTNDAKNSL